MIQSERCNSVQFGALWCNLDEYRQDDRQELLFLERVQLLKEEQGIFSACDLQRKLRIDEQKAKTIILALDQVNTLLKN